MLRGLYTSGLGMTTQMNRLNVISNNIANADTAGFKRDNVITQTFTQELMNRVNDPGMNRPRVQPIGTIRSGMFVDDIHTDFSQGGLRPSNSPVHMALSDRGFFGIQVTNAAGEAETRYTRDGSFVMGPGGLLMTTEGNYVLDADGGLITIPTGEIIVFTNGGIRVNGDVVAQLMLVDFENPQSLRKMGDNLFAVTDETIMQDFTGAVFQGYIELSNVNSVREMVEMIATMRNFELNQRAALAHDRHMDHIANSIARR
jgi:flagellar basal-body rod protein FlgG